jgi:hypothetical protein
MMRTSHSMARRRNEVRKGDIFENMDAQSSSFEDDPKSDSEACQGMKNAQK